MKVKMNVTGATELVTYLRSKAIKVPANGRKVMHSSAARIVKEAKLNAPEDDQELIDSIRQEVDYEQRGRLAITILMGGMIRGVDVTKYAALIHENYESMKPGKVTIAKRIANPGRYIGGKFLERARKAEEKRLLNAMISSVTEELKQ